MSATLKFWVALVAAIATAVGPLLAGAHDLGLVGSINVLVAGAGALYVFLTRNEHEGSAWQYAKTYAHAIATVGVLLVSVLSNGVSPMEWLQIGLAAAGTLGVFAVKNKTTGAHAL